MIKRIQGVNLVTVCKTYNNVNMSTNPPKVPAAIPKIPDKLPDKYVQKSCRVALLGALSSTGKALALLLKQNPVISQISLYDIESPSGLATDLRHLDTQSSITGYTNKDLNCAVRNADIIIMLGLESTKPDATLNQKLNTEGKRLVDLTTVSAIHAPKAIFIDCVIPLSLTLPIVSEVYRKHHWYHPGKVLGSVALQQMRINTIHAVRQELDPSCVHVPLLGGPEEDIMIPLFSRATPMPVQLAEGIQMVNCFRKLENDASPNAKSEAKHEYSPFGNAFAINRLVSTVALGLLGDSNAISTAFVRTNCVDVCKHLVTTVKFGPNGINHNYGVPKLTPFELSLFEKVTMELQKRENIAREFLETCDSYLKKNLSKEAEALHFKN